MFILFFSSRDFIDWNIHWLYLPIFYLAFFLNHSKYFGNALTIVKPFLSFKGITHAYLLKIPMTHNKRQISLINLLINCISAKWAPQILSLNEE